MKLSVEYLVLQRPWRDLFDEDQLAIARDRLRKVECELPPDDMVAEPAKPAEPKKEREAKKLKREPSVSGRSRPTIGTRKPAMRASGITEQPARSAASTLAASMAHWLTASFTSIISR